jgi:hypothetical protein
VNVRTAIAGGVAIAIVLAVALGVAGCGKPGERPVGGSPNGQAQPVKVDPYAPIPTEGAHEKAAMDAVPEALKYVEKTTEEQGREVTDLTGGTATLVSYTLQATVGKRTCLFEVRGDGKAYELYRYPDTPDPGKLFWQDAAVGKGARVAEPAGTGETAAATAVRKIVEEAVAGEQVKVAVYAYNFYWIKDDGTPVRTPGGAPFTLSIDPEGAAGSWSM